VRAYSIGTKKCGFSILSSAPLIYRRPFGKTYKHDICHVVLESCEMVRKVVVTVENQVEKALEEIRPRLQADGGDIEFMGVNEGVVKVKLKGACAGCPMSTMTLKMGVEQYLKKKIPEIVKVEAI
jgi:Fe-S cluster biogenesis protein NfuA